MGLRTPSNSGIKPRHVIFTVHGLAGNVETFGYFGEATKLYLSQIHPEYETQVVNFIYPSGQNEKNGAYDFAFSTEFGLNQFIQNYFKDKPLTSEDKISFVCHSQGGVIAYIWFFAQIINQNENFKYIKQTDSIITLGTPFWGTKIASILTDKRNPDVIPLIKAFAPANFKMTRHEISDLAFGSDTVDTFRKIAVKMDSDPKLSDLITALPVRLINITGILPQDEKKLFSSTSQSGALISGFTMDIINNIYKRFINNPNAKDKNFESDLAVPVPSSRWNFLYAPIQNVSQNLTIESNQYKDFSHLMKGSKFLFTQSSHLPFDNENTLSMAYINKTCLQVETCTHPTYRYIVEQLSNCKNSDCDKSAKEDIIDKMKAVNVNEHIEFRAMIHSLQTFAIQIHIKLKPGQIDSFPPQYFNKKYMADDGTMGLENWVFNDYGLEKNVIDLMTDQKTQISRASTSDYKIILGDKTEIHSVDIVSKSATPADPFDRLRINITGRIEDPRSTKSDSYVAPIEIKLPGLPTVKMNNLVKPSYSTYTELDYTN